MESLVIASPFDELLRAIGPAKRRMLAREIAFKLRNTQAERIAKQRNPEGTAFEPRRLRARKPQRKLNRPTKMFNKLRTLKYLRRRYSAAVAEVFIDGRAGRIANIHQYGLRARVGRQVVAMPQRKLLGFSKEDLAMIDDVIVRYLTEAT